MKGKKLTSAEAHAHLLVIYEAHNPDKIVSHYRAYVLARMIITMHYALLQAKIPELLQRYAGHEQELIQAVRMKYSHISAPGNGSEPQDARDESGKSTLDVLKILHNIQQSKEEDDTGNSSGPPCAPEAHAQRRNNLDSLEGWTSQDLAAEVCV